MYQAPTSPAPTEVMKATEVPPVTIDQVMNTFNVVLQEQASYYQTLITILLSAFAIIGILLAVWSFFKDERLAKAAVKTAMKKREKELKKELGNALDVKLKAAIKTHKEELKIIEARVNYNMSSTTDDLFVKAFLSLEALKCKVQAGQRFKSENIRMEATRCLNFFKDMKENDEKIPDEAKNKLAQNLNILPDYLNLEVVEIREIISHLNGE